MKKHEKNQLVFDHVEELLVRISLDLAEEIKGLSLQKAEEIETIILAINFGELISFSQNGLGEQLFTIKMQDNSTIVLKRSMERMPFTAHNKIEEDANWWFIVSHKQAGTLS